MTTDQISLESEGERQGSCLTFAKHSHISVELPSPLTFPARLVTRGLCKAFIIFQPFDLKQFFPCYLLDFEISLVTQPFDFSILGSRSLSANSSSWFSDFWIVP